MASTRLFIASLGNPKALACTRHSAGHVLIKALHGHLRLQPFGQVKEYGGGQVALGSYTGQAEYTLWQSPTMMNVSGPKMLQAYNRFVATEASQGGLAARPALVVLHDEMETAPGKLKIRHGPTSPKGHNGLKSVQASLQGAGVMRSLESGPGGPRFIKVAIGIGRPQGDTREPAAVSKFVLAPLTSAERREIEALAPELERLLEAEMARLG